MVHSPFQFYSTKMALAALGFTTCQALLVVVIDAHAEIV
jgi:hypothetical protein